MLCWQCTVCPAPLSPLSLFHPSVTQFPWGFQLPVKVFHQLSKWERISAARIPFAINRAVGICFAWSCRTEATFWWGRVGVNTSVKTMTDAVAQYKFTMASTASTVSNIRGHQGSPLQKKKNERVKRAEEKGSGVRGGVYYGAEEFAWELGLTD